MFLTKIRLRPNPLTLTLRALVWSSDPGVNPAARSIKTRAISEVLCNLASASLTCTRHIPIVNSDRLRWLLKSIKSIKSLLARLIYLIALLAGFEAIVAAPANKPVGVSKKLRAVVLPF